MERHHSEDGTTGGLRPRVVVLETPGDVAVRVLDLPPCASPGERFLHGCRAWTVVAVRERSGVLFARPATC